MPMDIFDLGRMSAIADPNGAPAALWRAGSHIGAGVMFEHGTFTWAQLITRDREASTTFHRKLLGLGDSGPAPGGGVNLTLDHEPMVGIMDAGRFNWPPNHWIVYFHVTSMRRLGRCEWRFGCNVAEPTSAASR